MDPIAKALADFVKQLDKHGGVHMGTRMALYSEVYKFVFGRDRRCREMDESKDALRTSVRRGVAEGVATMEFRSTDDLLAFVDQIKAALGHRILRFVFRKSREQDWIDDILGAVDEACFTPGGPGEAAAARHFRCGFRAPGTLGQQGTMCKLVSGDGGLQHSFLLARRGGSHLGR